jgi:chromosome segregation ATPase
MSCSPRGVDRDTVLLKCKDAIEHLHLEVEEERDRSENLQSRLRMVEAELSRARADAASESARRKEAVAENTRLQTQVAEYESRLAYSSAEKNSTFRDVDFLSNICLSQVEQLRDEVTSLNKELINRQSRIRKLEDALASAERRATDANDEVRHLRLDLETVSDRVVSCETEKESLKLKLDAVIAENDRRIKIANDETNLMSFRMERQVIKIQFVVFFIFRQKKIKHGKRQANLIFCRIQVRRNFKC